MIVRGRNHVCFARRTTVNHNIINLFIRLLLIFSWDRMPFVPPINRHIGCVCLKFVEPCIGQEIKLALPIHSDLFGGDKSDLPWFNQQQHDSADKGEGADCRRDEVAVSGLDVHAEEIDRLPWRREVKARVSEYHDAQRDQNDGSYCFCVHVELLLV